MWLCKSKWFHNYFLRVLAGDIETSSCLYIFGELRHKDNLQSALRYPLLVTRLFMSHNQLHNKKWEKRS